MEQAQTHYTGLARITTALESLKKGLESDLTSNDRECLDTMMGRMCDIAVGYHVPITHYTTWLANYRVNRQNTKIGRNASNNETIYCGDDS